MTNRRNFLRGVSGGALVGAVGPGCAPPTSTPKPTGRDYFAELGLTEFINAGEPYTAFTGALMPQEAVDAYTYAASRYVLLNDLHDAIGKKIAEMCNCEAAMVTAGAASGLTLATAACVTRGESQAVKQLPDIAGLKSEVIIQKAHRYGYERAVLNCGVKFVEVETREQLENAISDKTAMMLFNNTNDPDGQIKVAEFAELGKKHNVPTLDDCAADVPPKEHLWEYLDMGFDLMTASGGKGISGPQNAGLLLGRKDLIEAARVNAPPNGGGIGRGMKVNKETMLAMLVALEVFLARDHEAEWREWESRVKLIADEVSKIDGVETEMFAPPLHYHVPHLRIQWDQAKLGLSPEDVKKQLREGTPAIQLRSSPSDCIELGVWMLKEGETETVARRLAEIITPSA